MKKVFCGDGAWLAVPYLVARFVEAEGSYSLQFLKKEIDVLVATSTG